MNRLPTNHGAFPACRWSTTTGRLVSAVIVLGPLLLVFGRVYISPPRTSQAGAPTLTDRNVGLAGLLLALLILRLARPLAAVLMASALVHVWDGIVDVPTGDYGGVAGSLVFAVISAAAAAWLLRRSTIDEAP